MKEALDDESTRGILEDMRDDGATYYVYENTGFPGFTLTIAGNDVVGLVASDSEYVFIQSYDQEVLAWAEDMYNQFLNSAIELDAYR